MVNVKKIFIAITAVVAGANATVLTHQETFNDVKVIYPAKSTQTTCKTRVDLSEGLVDNTLGCKIEKIMVYNKNRMWIGSLGSVEEGRHLRYADYDVNRYKGKGTQIGIEYSFTPQDADLFNRWMVSCPKGMVAYIDEEYYSCKKPYTCIDGWYAIDKVECEELPEGAHRNSTTGYSCNKGYVMRNYGQCEVKSTCGKNDLYVESENTCYERPDHAHWIKDSLEWACNDGFVQIDEHCEVKAECDHYNSADNSCYEKPENSHWVESTGESWACNDGFVQIDEHCEVKAVCSSEQRYDESENSCVDPYPNSRWVDDYGNYACNDGYVNVGEGRCEVKAVCSSEQRYDVNNNSCYEKPKNSHWVYSDGKSWACNDGWWNNGKFCEETVSCGWFERYNAFNNTCVSKPSHSHWVSEWWNYACDDGYYERYGECAEINPTSLSDYTKFFHSLTFIIGVGGAKDKSYEQITLVNTALEYSIGIRAGTDFFNVRPHTVIGLLYSWFEYYSYDSYGTSYLDESLFSMALVVGIGLGVDIWHFTIDYNYLYAGRETLANVDFYSTLNQCKVGYNLNEHWNINITVIYQLIKTTKILKEYDNNIFNIGVSYAF